MSTSDSVAVSCTPHVPGSAVIRYRGFGESSLLDFREGDATVLFGKKMVTYRNIGHTLSVRENNVC